MTSKFAQWRQSLDDKYGISGKNQMVNDNINHLRGMKHEINIKINDIHEERQKNLNILKKEIDIKLNEYHNELKDMKKEVEEKMKEWNEKKNQNDNKPNLRKKKRKYGEIE